MFRNVLLIVLLSYAIIATTSIDLYSKQTVILMDAYNNKEEFSICMRNYKGAGTGFKECGLIRLEDKMNTFEKYMNIYVLKPLDKILGLFS